MYSVYPCPVETSRRSILELWFFYILYLPFVLLRQKGGVFVFFDPKCIFRLVKYFCPRMAKGGVC